MEQLKLKRTKIELEIDDKKFVLTKPNYGELKQYNQKRKAINDEDTESLADLTVDFLVMAGLPKEVVESLEMSMVIQLVELLSDSKKN